MEKIRKFYIDGDGGGGGQNESGLTSEMDKYTNLFSDRYFIFPESQSAEMQSIHAPVYLYHFTLVKPGGFSMADVLQMLGNYYPQLEFAYNLISYLIRKNILNWDIPNYGKQEGY